MLGRIVFHGHKILLKLESMSESDDSLTREALADISSEFCSLITPENVSAEESRDRMTLVLTWRLLSIIFVAHEPQDDLRPDIFAWLDAVIDAHHPTTSESWASDMFARLEDSALPSVRVDQLTSIHGDTAARFADEPLVIIAGHILAGRINDGLALALADAPDVSSFARAHLFDVLYRVGLDVDRVAAFTAYSETIIDDQGDSAWYVASMYLLRASTFDPLAELLRNVTRRATRDAVRHRTFAVAATIADCLPGLTAELAEISAQAHSDTGHTAGVLYWRLRGDGTSRVKVTTAIGDAIDGYIAEDGPPTHDVALEALQGAAGAGVEYEGDPTPLGGLSVLLAIRRVDLAIKDQDPRRVGSWLSVLLSLPRPLPELWPSLLVYLLPRLRPYLPGLPVHIILTMAQHLIANTVHWRAEDMAQPTEEALIEARRVLAAGLTDAIVASQSG